MGVCLTVGAAVAAGDHSEEGEGKEREVDRQRRLQRASPAVCSGRQKDEP